MFHILYTAVSLQRCSCLYEQAIGSTYGNCFTAYDIINSYPLIVNGVQFVVPLMCLIIINTMFFVKLMKRMRRMSECKHVGVSTPGDYNNTVNVIGGKTARKTKCPPALDETKCKDRNHHGVSTEEPTSEFSIVTGMTAIDQVNIIIEKTFKKHPFHRKYTVRRRKADLGNRQQVFSIAPPMRTEPHRRMGTELVQRT